MNNNDNIKKLTDKIDKRIKELEAGVKKASSESNEIHDHKDIENEIEEEKEKINDWASRVLGLEKPYEDVLDTEPIPSFDEWLRQRASNEHITRRKDVVFSDIENKMLGFVVSQISKYKIKGLVDGFNNIGNVYKSLPDELRDELVEHKTAYKDGRRIKFRGEDQCILRFLAYEEDYPSEDHDEILDCIYKLKNGRRLNSDNRVIIEGVLEGLVNHDWTGEKPFQKSVKEVKEGMESIIGQELAVEQMLKCYNILAHTHKAGPHVIRIKAEDGMGVDTLVKTFAASIGRYCEISCQNLGYDPETTAGSSRIYCNSSPGELAEAIINNDVQVIILKNINDADDRIIARLSAFFENTFVDNYYRVRVPDDVLVICTESASGNKTPEYIYRDAYTIELTKYSDDESRKIAKNIIERFNEEFGLKLSFDDMAMEKVISSNSTKEIQRVLLDVFSNISFENELSSNESIEVTRTITLKDLT